MAWKKDLAHVLTRKRRIWMRGVLRPRLHILPTLWKGYGAWTLFTVIFVTHKQASCPAQVRQYIVSHEFGHLYGGHVYLQFLFILSYAVLTMSATTQPAVALLTLAFTCTLFAAFVKPSLALEREVYADSVAVELYGAEATIAGFLWMAHRTNGIHGKERKARIARLRLLSAATT
jgi:Peptidase family M48